jgi:hypothetical protein
MEGRVAVGKYFSDGGAMRVAAKGSFIFRKNACFLQEHA